MSFRAAPAIDGERLSAYRPSMPVELSSRPLPAYGRPGKVVECFTMAGKPRVPESAD